MGAGRDNPRQDQTRRNAISRGRSKRRSTDSLLRSVYTSVGAYRAAETQVVAAAAAAAALATRRDSPRPALAFPERIPRLRTGSIHSHSHGVRR
ncbi:hypothetical protein Mapa_008713 [Marchantia paleacea]|nr:hypothetical protein Mapa_008713 [Marchantia paleacea]